MAVMQRVQRGMASRQANPAGESCRRILQARHALQEDAPGPRKPSDEDCRRLPERLLRPLPKRLPSTCAMRTTAPSAPARRSTCTAPRDVGKRSWRPSRVALLMQSLERAKGPRVLQATSCKPHPPHLASVRADRLQRAALVLVHRPGVLPATRAAGTRKQQRS
jgi:hypothetical protein